jgi:hypothetical protein
MAFSERRVTILARPGHKVYCPWDTAGLTLRLICCLRRVPRMRRFPGEAAGHQVATSSHVVGNASCGGYRDTGQMAVGALPVGLN